MYIPAFVIVVLIAVGWASVNEKKEDIEDEPSSSIFGTKAVVLWSSLGEPLLALTSTRDPVPDFTAWQSQRTKAPSPQLLWVSYK